MNTSEGNGWLWRADVKLDEITSGARIKINSNKMERVCFCLLVDRAWDVGVLVLSTEEKHGLIVRSVDSPW